MLLHILTLYEKIKDYHSKVSALETSFSELITKHARDKQIMEEKFAQEKTDLQTNIKDMSLKLQARTKELLTLQKLAKNVLSQRTELEQFFMDALSHVKSEKIKEAQEEKKRMPEIKKNGAIPKLKTERSHMTLNIADAANFESFGWDDKEKVLRLLFAKINGMQSPAANFVTTNPTAEKIHRKTNTPNTMSTYRSLASGRQQKSSHGTDESPDDKSDITFLTNMNSMQQ